MEEISNTKRTHWHSLISDTDMKNSSKKAWGLMKKLDCDPSTPNMLGPVTANQVAHQLLLNGKTKKINKAMSQRLKDGEKDKKSKPESEQGILKENFSELNSKKPSMNLKTGKPQGWITYILNKLRILDEKPKIGYLICLMVFYLRS